jgi:hypothetical protein
VSDQPALTEEDLERLRHEHYNLLMEVDTATAKRGDPLNVCHACDQADAANPDWPCVVIRVLDQFDAERARRQAAEEELSDSREMRDGLGEELTAVHTALAEMTERAERAESVLADQAQQMREDITRRHAVERRLAEERQARETLPSTADVESVRTDHALFRDTDDETGEPFTYCEMDGESYPCMTIRSLNALAACEARLAEAERWRDFYRSALHRGRAAFDAGDIEEVRTAFSCGLVIATNEEDLAWAKAWLATEEGRQALAEVRAAQPAPPPVEGER